MRLQSETVCASWLKKYFCCCFTPCSRIFTYTTAASITVEGNRTVPRGNLRPSAGCWQTFYKCAHRMSVSHCRLAVRNIVPSPRCLRRAVEGLYDWIQWWPSQASILAFYEDRTISPHTRCENVWKIRLTLPPYTLHKSIFKKKICWNWVIFKRLD